MAFWNSTQIIGINEGTTPNDGTGDNIRDAFTKVDENFANVSIQLAQFNQDWTNANIEYNLKANFGNISNLFVANSTGTTSNFTGNSSAGNIIANTGLYSNGTSHFRGNLYMSGNILPTSYGTFNLGSPAFPFGNLYVQNTISTNQISASSDAGMLLVHANAVIGSPVDVGIMGNISTVAGSNLYSFFGYRASTSSFMFATTPVNTAIGNSIVSAYTLGNLQVGSQRVSNTTTSTSTTTGALIVSGGTGIAGALYVGGNINSSASINSTNGIYSGGYQVITTASQGFGNIYNGTNSVFVGNTIFPAATQSVSYTTGAIVVPFGGIGVFGNIVAGGYVGTVHGAQNSITSLTVGGNVTITTGQMNIRAVQATSLNTTDLTATGTVSFTGVTLAGLANVTASIVNSTGNVGVAGALNAVGNVAGSYFLGNGALLTGLTTNLQFAGLSANVTAANAAIQVLSANVGSYQSWANASFRSTSFSTTTGVITNFSTSNAQVTSGSAGTLVATNFSSGNAVITSCDTATFDATTGVITNFSSGNIRVSGGYISALANIQATTAGLGTTTTVALNTTTANITGGASAGTLVATNFSTGNAQITSCDTSTLDATTGVITNFSSGNAVITSGYAQGLANVRAAEGQFANFSTGNAIITSGSATTIVTTNFSTGNAIITSVSTTSASATTLVALNFSSSNIRVSGGYAQGLANVRATEGQFTNFSTGNAVITSCDTSTFDATTGVITNFSSGNAVITSGYAQGLANVRATEGQFTNFSTGNAVITSCDTATFDATTGVITNFSSGNAQITSGSAGTLVATNFSSGNAIITSCDTATLDATTGVITNFSSGNIRVSGGYAQGLANVRATEGQFTNFSTGNAVITSCDTSTFDATTGVITNFSSGNVVISGGYISTVANVQATAAGLGTTTTVTLNATSGNITNLGSTTGVITNFSSGNAQVTAGSVGTLVATNFSSGNAQITSANTGTLVTTNFSTGNAVITSCDTSTFDATTGVITNFSSGNIRVSGGYITGLANISTNGLAGNATISGNINLTGSIIPNANVTSNLGDSTHWFGTLFGISTQAKYADLAERYVADDKYEPGTVVVFGGEFEITVTDTFADTCVAGAISTDPAYLMNAAADGLPVALRGRIPCKVIGPVHKGDLLVTAGNQPGYAVSVGSNKSHGVSIFAKSLVTDLSEGEKIIEVVII